MPRRAKVSLRRVTATRRQVLKTAHLAQNSPLAGVGGEDGVLQKLKHLRLLWMLRPLIVRVNKTLPPNQHRLKKVLRLRQPLLRSESVDETAVISAASHAAIRSEEHTSELQSRLHLVCRLLLE